jgi:hypothetical protein
MSKKLQNHLQEISLTHWQLFEQYEKLMWEKGTNFISLSAKKAMFCFSVLFLFYNPLWSYLLKWRKWRKWRKEETERKDKP